MTGTYGSGASALFLVDTRTRHLAVYRLRNGRHLEFLAARDCMYDFFIETYNDQSAPELLPGVLKKGWRHFNKTGGPEPAPEKAVKPAGRDKKKADKDK